MPHLTIKTLSKKFYSTVGAKTLQTACTTRKWGTFCRPSENLNSRMSKKGGNITLLQGH